MKKLLLVLVLCMFVAYVYHSFSSEAAIQSPKQEQVQKPKQKKRVADGTKLQGKIIAVKDGDSLELLDAENTIHEIRLAHVDCPERRQAFGTKAKIFTSDFCFGKRVTAYVTDTDRYGRKVCVVEAEGEELNLAIIGAGYGWHYQQYSKSRVHAAAEVEARRKKVGLWADKQAVAPWEYRKRK